MQRIWLIIAAVALQTGALADEPATKYQLVAPRDDGIMATGINNRGDVVGFQWLEEKDQPDVVSQMPFFARGKTLTRLPLLAGYTATEPAGVSDTGVVVGRAGKPAPPGVRVHLRNQAFVWDAVTGIHGIGTLHDDTASYACGVTRDGTCISGVSVGDGRLRACVWDRVGNDWKARPLPQAGQLGSQVVKISDNGRYVVSIDGTIPCLWTRADGGAWTREVIGDSGSLAPRAVNNSGVVVGLSYVGDALTDAAIWSARVGITHLEKPKGYIRAEANAINNAGVVVGMVDGPHGSPTGPNAFVYEKGRFRMLNEFGPAFTNATAINDTGQVTGDLDKEDAAEAHQRDQSRPKTPDSGKP